MFNWITVVGTIVYTLVGLLAMNVTEKHVRNLEAVVEKIDPRYCKRLWYRVDLKKTTANRILMDILFLVAWPAICIAVILKAEWQYDLIVNHSAFRRNAS